ncbi:MAG: hypothetical protein EKK40_02820 [Bradyrhizobiaceae bacterium]|nr:MAG: hypothetical protein EKK40_02820 [Bradyrhizobiaceae bacterium]
MPYALFTNDEQISKAYKTEHEVWKKADEAGLVVDVVSDEEKADPKRVLDEDYCIRPCAADVEEPAVQQEQNSGHDAHSHSRRPGTQPAGHTGRRAAAAAK